MDAKRAEFDRLWNTDATAKRDQFRSLMRSKLEQIGVPFTEENARGYYLGTVKASPRSLEPERPPPRESFRPRRRPPRRR